MINKLRSASPLMFALLTGLVVIGLSTAGHASPPTPNVSWVFGPDPATQGGTCNLPDGHTATLDLTINGQTRSFTLNKGDTGSKIGWWTFPKSTNNSTDVSWKVRVKNRSGQIVAQSDFTKSGAGEPDILNMSAPSSGNQVLKLYASCKYKGAFNIYLKDPNSVGSEVVYLLFNFR